jgi:hypothetical protein
LNNLEKDKIYKKWTKSLSTLLFPSWNLHSIARNLYTVVITIDILSEEGFSLLQSLKSLHQEMFPVRLGLVLYCGRRATSETKKKSGSREGQAAEKEERDDELRRNVCRLFASFKDFTNEKANEKNVPFAITFLESVAAKYLEEKNVLRTSVEQDLPSVVSAFSSSFSLDSLLSLYLEYLPMSSNYKRKNEWLPVSGGDGKGQDDDFHRVKAMLLTTSTFNDFVDNSTEYYRQRNLPINSYSFNGIVVQGESTFSNGLMRLLGREQYLLSNYVRFGLLPDSTKSIFEKIMKLSSAYSRYHPLLDDIVNEEGEGDSGSDSSALSYDGSSSPSSSPLVNLMRSGKFSENTRFLKEDMIYLNSYLTSDLTADMMSIFQSTSHLLHVFVPVNEYGFSLIAQLLSWQLTSSSLSSAVTSSPASPQSDYQSYHFKSQLVIEWIPSTSSGGPENLEQECVVNNEKQVCEVKSAALLASYERVELFNHVRSVFSFFHPYNKRFCNRLCVSTLLEVGTKFLCLPLLFVSDCAFRLLRFLALRSRS